MARMHTTFIITANFELIAWLNQVRPEVDAENRVVEQLNYYDHN